jgi:uncharacterized membrane protein
MKLGKNSLIALGLSIVAVILILLMTSFNAKVADLVCDCINHESGQNCPFRGTLPIEVYLDYTLSASLILMAAYLFVSDQRALKLSSMSERRWERVTSALRGDEKTIYNLIASTDGVMFQSDIVKNTQFPKARVSRVLNGLEARNLLERRRSGMSNVIVLKSPSIENPK